MSNLKPKVPKKEIRYNRMEMMAVRAIMEIGFVIVGGGRESMCVYLTPLAVWLIEYILICMVKKWSRNRCLYCNKGGQQLHLPTSCCSSGKCLSL
jgi:hypothetical protein